MNEQKSLIYEHRTLKVQHICQILRLRSAIMKHLDWKDRLLEEAET